MLVYFDNLFVDNTQNTDKPSKYGKSGTSPALLPKHLCRTLLFFSALYSSTKFNLVLFVTILLLFSILGTIIITTYY